MTHTFRRFTGLAAVVAGTSATILAGIGTVPAYADGDTGCGNGGAVIVAGTNAPRNAQGVPTGGVTGIGARYRDQGYQVQYVDYPTDLWPLGEIPYDQDVAIGKSATERAVAGYQARCPGKPVVVAGYSQGARIAGDVLSETGTGQGPRVKTGSGYRKLSPKGMSGELYSDPRRDGSPAGGGIETELIGLVPGTTMTGPRPGGFGNVPVTQYCLQGDPICDLPSPFRYPVAAVDGFVGYFTKHGYYPARMREPVNDGQAWDCEAGAASAAAPADCVVPARPATVELAHDTVDPVLAQAGLPQLFDGRFASVMPTPQTSTGVVFPTVLVTPATGEQPQPAPGLELPAPELPSLELPSPELPGLAQLGSELTDALPPSAALPDSGPTTTELNTVDPTAAQPAPAESNSAESNPAESNPTELNPVESNSAELNNAVEAVGRVVDEVSAAILGGRRSGVAEVTPAADATVEPVTAHPAV